LPDSVSVPHSGIDATIELARESDLQALLLLQRLCYRSEAELYKDFSLPPLTQTLEDLRTDLDSHLVLAARHQEELVGSVRARMSSKTCQIGRLMVHPLQRRRGLGSGLMHAIESRFPQADRFELFTGHKSLGNLLLYDRLGYRSVREEAVAPHLTLIYMEKSRG
jgi:predicted N-acetyltransferase YhbS